MRIIYLFLLLGGAVLPATAFAYDHIVSPNGKLEAYTTAADTDGTGTKLFVRPGGSSAEGILLATNRRWMDAKWSPDSRFLAVEDHWDGHSSDVYVFGINRPDGSSTPKLTLYAHNPKLETYDVKWEVAGWSLRQRDVLLTKTVKFRLLPGRAHLHIGTRPLPVSAWPISAD